MNNFAWGKAHLQELHEKFLYIYWLIFTYYKDKIWDWFRYRLWDRYHVLRIHEPGYTDPRHELIQASMAIVGRYVNELRGNSFDDYIEEQASDVEVLQFYIDIYKERIENGDTMVAHWLNHYIVLRTVVKWWETAKDNVYLDTWTREEIDRYGSSVFETEEEIPEDSLTSDYVDDILRKVVELRQGMWT